MTLSGKFWLNTSKKNICFLISFRYRPHWSKVIRDDTPYLHEVFPKLKDFIALQKKLGIFLHTLPVIFRSKWNFFESIFVRGYGIT